jgi:hypothetical protein
MAPSDERPHLRGRSAQHSDRPLFGNSQGGVPRRWIFLWWAALFLAAEKPEKSGKSQKIVQKLFRE